MRYHHVHAGPAGSSATVVRGPGLRPHRPRAEGIGDPAGDRDLGEQRLDGVGEAPPQPASGLRGGG